MLVIVGLPGALLLFAIPLLRRATPAAARAHPPDTPEALARAIAALDAGHERGPRDPAETAAYRAERAALKARLADALARGQGGR